MQHSKVIIAVRKMGARGGSIIKVKKKKLVKICKLEEK